MRVDTRPAPPTLGVATAARTNTGPNAFTPTGTDQTETRASTAAAAQTSVLSGLDALLTLQADGSDPQERRRRSVGRGQDLLDGLDRLKAALLGGRVATGELRAIAQRLAQRASASGDPRLDGLVGEIEVRAAVELAKLETGRRA